MDFETILVDTHGRVGLVRLNRPEVFNALNNTMLHELMESLESFDADEGIGAIVVACEIEASCQDEFDVALTDCRFEGHIGVAVTCIEVGLNIEGCEFIENRAREEGSAIYYSGPGARVHGSAFVGNRSIANGGVIVFGGRTAEVGNLADLWLLAP